MTSDRVELMKFTLRYEGELHSQGPDDRESRAKRAPEIWSIRRAIHLQMARLWTRSPITDYGHHHYFDPIDIKGHPFCPLIREESMTLAKIEILLLRPDEAGNIVNNNGDLDNRLKTLLDGLRAPLPGDNGEFPPDLPRPFYSLLQDDFLISELSIRTAPLLIAEDDKPAWVNVSVDVTVAVPRLTAINSGLLG